MHCEPTNSRLRRCFAQNIYMDRGWQNKTTKTKTYNTEDSLVVTHPTTGSALTSLTRGERTGSRIASRIWSYVVVRGWGSD